MINKLIEQYEDDELEQLPEEYKFIKRLKELLKKDRLSVKELNEIFGKKCSLGKYCLFFK